LTTLAITAILVILWCLQVSLQKPETFDKHQAIPDGFKSELMFLVVLLLLINLECCVSVKSPAPLLHKKILLLKKKYCIT